MAGAYAGSGTQEQSTFLTLLMQNNMKNNQSEQNVPKAKPPIFAGIDVGSEEVVLVIRKNGKPFEPQTIPNTPAGHAKLVKKLGKLPGIIVCMEATGVYHFDESGCSSRCRYIGDGNQSKSVT
jgi:hypothetical protein